MTPKTSFARATAAACLLVLAAPATAQPLQTAGPPADFPPEDYEGRQFVDSRGCVYVRAGVDGSVTWVPRVNRDREQLCGFQPTFADAPAPAAPAETQLADTPAPETPAPDTPAPDTPAPETPAPDTAEPDTVEPETAEPETQPAPRTAEAPASESRTPEPQERAAPAREAQPTAAAPRPTQRQQRATQPAPERIEVPRRALVPPPRATADPMPTVASAPAPQRRPAAAPATAAQRPAVVAGARCPGGTAVSQRYLVGRDGERLRCSPQARPPHSYRILSAEEVQARPAAPRVYRYARADSGGSGKVYRSVSGRPVSGEARVLPRHLWQPPLPESARVEVPEGYEPAWKDGRLNPRRAEQTLDGRERMLLVWTNTTPRRLLDRASGEDVTARHPRLFYPFTDIATQNAYLSAKDELEVRVAGDGRVRLVQKPGAPTRVATRSAPAREAPAQAVREARAAPSAPDPGAKAAHRFLQVGTFGVPANAQRSAVRLQSLGLPVRLSRMTRGGESYQVVLAGPFTSEAQLRGALATVRRAGFADAFPRN